MRLRAHQGFDTTPLANELQKIWPHNMCAGRARDGSVVRFEAWGSVDMSELERSWLGAAAGMAAAGAENRADVAWSYLEELQNVTVVALSHHERCVVQVTLLVDAGGLTTRHGELLGVLACASV